MFISRKDYNKLRKLKNVRALHKGSQTLAYLCKSDIIIYTGERGIGKSTMLLNKLLKFIDVPNYNALILRREYGDMEKAGGIVDASQRVYSQFGRYLSSSKMWSFPNNGKIGFNNYSNPLNEFRENIQGKENVHVGVDEITHMPEGHFNEIFSNLRNTIGIKPQIIGTCNPDPNSWIKTLIARYIDVNTGFHLPPLNGREIYFFQYGNTIKESIWGLTRQEVYDNAKEYIDPYWDKSMAKYGSVLDMILSITVFDAKTSENETLMSSGGVAYKGRLLKGSLEMKHRYAVNCWSIVDSGEGLVSEKDMQSMFYNSEKRTGERFASMDVGGEGQDKTVMFIWDGFHIENVYMTKSKKSNELEIWAKRILMQEKIDIRNFVYDAGGLGWGLSGRFEGSLEFISNTKQTEIRDYENKLVKIYSNFKSQTIGAFLRYLKGIDNNGDCDISIDTKLLNKDFFGETLASHLTKESKAIRWSNQKDGVLSSISRDEVRKLIGHSADIIYALIYRFAFNLDEAFSFTPFEEDDFNRIATFITL